MKAQELAAITKQAIDKNLNERPTKLLEEILPKMKSQAERGQYYIDYRPIDESKIVNVVIGMLRDRGYEVSHPGHDLTILRISWDKAKPVFKPEVVECPFTIAWVGTCKKPADKTGFCEEHRKVKCRCGKQAITECDATIGPLVCGWPTCGSCSHSH